MYSSSYILQQVINGLNLGSIYALVAIGLTIVYGILRLINFAHGDVMMLGAYLALALLLHQFVPLALVILIPMIVIGALGILIERVAYRPLRGAPEVAMLITSLAVSSIIQNGVTMTITAQPRSFRLPTEWVQRHTVAGVSFSTLDVLTVSLALLLMLLLTLFVTRTRVGIAMRACSENLNAARLMGIPIGQVVAAAFAIGSALAAIAGFFWAGKFGTVDPFMGFLPGLKAFVAAVIGGIGSIPGAVLGGYLLGFSEIFFVGFLPPSFSGYRDAFVFILLLVVLLVRPQGLLRTTSEERD
ncbi:MAG: branched-chain amino acid ABC transporter permease [Chloroflexi bacterium]|nr:branched-chain amino acid ABC transporter permease [Chloroflexota bacterium]